MKDKIKTDQKDLMSVSKKNFILSDTLIKKIDFSNKVPGTHWALVSLPFNGLYENELEAIIRSSGLLLAVFIFLSLIMMLLLNDKDRKRASAESDLNAAMIEAKKANKAKSEFLAHMSHEIRTPLNAAIGYTDLLLESEKIEGEDEKMLSSIKSSGRHLLSLINNILDFSKLSARKFVFRDEFINLELLANDVTDILHVSATRKSIKFGLHTFPEIGKYEYNTDATRLQQVLMNLAGNAIKFTDTGEVDVNIVKISQDEKIITLKITVSDTGIGIPKENLESIFETFEQVDLSSTKKHQGTGLGLAIANMIVQKLGSKIELESTLGKGSIFSFELPLNYRVAAIQVDQPKEKVPVKVSEKCSQKILLVDDSKINLELLAAILNKSDISLLKTAENGEIALKMSKEEKFDLIFMDCMMPVMNGFDATKNIRKKGNPNCETIIVAITANAGDKAKSDCLEAGMNDFLSKPFRITQIRNLLTRHIKKANKDHE